MGGFGIFVYGESGLFRQNNSISGLTATYTEKEGTERKGKEWNGQARNGKQLKIHTDTTNPAAASST